MCVLHISAPGSAIPKSSHLIGEERVDIGDATFDMDPIKIQSTSANSIMPRKDVCKVEGPIESYCPDGYHCCEHSLTSICCKNGHSCCHNNSDCC